MKAENARVQIIYQNKDITNDVSEFLISFEYEDNVGGEADEITLSFDDSEGFWANSWYPKKGDKIQPTISYNGLSLDCGLFFVDSITYGGKPDVITIKALSTSFSQSFQTEKTNVYENVTLSSLVNNFASKNGLSVIGTIADIRFNRIAQNRKTDVSFLNELAKKYGYVFSIKGDNLVFYSIFELDKQNPISTYTKEQVINYTFSDDLAKVFKNASLDYRNPIENKVINSRNNTGSDETENVLTIKTKVENQSQADAITKAKLYESNTQGILATLNIEGDCLLSAGVNIILENFGYFSGVWAILKTIHTVSDAYFCTINAKKIQ